MLESSFETYPLTTIDLANLCARPEGERYRVLRTWPKPKFWVSYRPIRTNWSKLIGREPTLSLQLAEDRKDLFLAHIARSCRHGQRDVEANLAVAEAVWDWASENSAKSISHSFPVHRCSLATNRFFEDGIVVVGDKGLALLLDPRTSSSALDAFGRSFAFSAMYWAIAGIADYVDIDLAIMRITDGRTERRAKLVEFNGHPTFSKSEVEDRIERTQQIWLDVQLERRDRSARGKRS